MYTVYNGKLINNLQDVLDVLRDKLGDEFADTAENIVSDMVSTAVSTADAATIDSMSDQIEVTNEGWATIVRDARDNIDEILSNPRIDRRALARIRDDLNAEL